MNENETARIAAAIAALRPDWPAASIRTLIATKLNDRPRRDVAVALAWVACDSTTITPARVLEAGPWWKAAIADNAQGTTSHTGKTAGSDGDPREVCGICAMWRADCTQRYGTSGHKFVARINCLPATQVGALGVRGRCLAGPRDGPLCQLTTGHDGIHECDQEIPA